MSTKRVKQSNTLAADTPLLAPPHVAGEHVYCNNCGLMIGIITEGGNLLLMTGHLVRFPTTLKCPPPCGKNLRLGERFQAWRTFAKRDTYPNPRPGLSLDIPDDV